MQTDYDVTIDPAVFNPVYLPHLNNMTRTQIYYGGSSSGKSVFIVGQRTVYDMLKGGRNYLIVRQVARTVRNSVYNEILKVIHDWGVADLFNVNKSDMVITCANGYQILFGGLDDVEKMKSITPAKGVITDIVIEEATEAERATVKQLYKRQRGGDDSIPKRLVLLFNPVLQSHWIYTDFFAPIAWADNQTVHSGDDLFILKTTYKDNCFLTPDDVRDLENETDPYFFNVYSLGNWGVLGNVIFTNWRVEDLSYMRDQFTNRRNGLDFGFSSDPAALSVSHYDRMYKTIYIFGELYETGLTNDLLAVEVRGQIGRELVTCDSSEPKSVVELQRNGVNARGARKGKDSVNYGIQWLQQQKIVIDVGCINHRNEFQQYKWKEDASGNAMRVPVDKHNHLIDALRYAYEDDAAEYGVQVISDPFADW